MRLEAYFKKTIQERESGESPDGSLPEAPANLMKRCNFCHAAIFTDEVRQNRNRCPKCGGYFRMHAHHRLEQIVDDGTFTEWDTDLQDQNPLQFSGYAEKLEEVRKKTGLREAIVTGQGKICGHDTVIGVCDGRFLMASMGETVGEKITRAFERATRESLPVILFACSGGARMQEGIVSLMQMAKTAAAIRRHSEAGLLYISVLTDPTTGGVTASWAMLGDIILAEPGALIGFAGPRVIEQTIRQKLPKGFQRAEFLLQHGFLDAVVARDEMKEMLGKLLLLHQRDTVCGSDEHAEGRQVREKGSVPGAAGSGTEQGTANLQETMETAGPHLTAWEEVELARDKERPVGTDYLNALFTDFVEFHGDRYFGDDGAIVGGTALFEGRPVTVIVQEKGKTTKEQIRRNFGMPSPEGYRKALRLMRQAEKFHRPVICFVDTPGAYCGMEAEERGQGEAIARNLYEMSALKVPVLSIVIGEGGSGGALALAAADEVWMLEHSIYSILSPEGFAAILWKDQNRAREAAGRMKITARELKALGIIERMIGEPERLTRETLPEVLEELGREIQRFLTQYEKLEPEDLTGRRYQRFRVM